MATSFPGAQDNLPDPTPSTATNDPSIGHAELHVSENDCIEAIENVILTGTGFPIALVQKTDQPGGDVTGTSGGPLTVAKIQNNAVASTAPTDTQVLSWSAANSRWQPTTVAGLIAAVTSVFGRTGAVTAGSGDYTVAQVTGAAPLASPTFTGTPAAPTAAASTNTTQLATTAFVTAAVAAVNPLTSVAAATTAASDTSGLTYNNGTSGVGATLTGANNTPVTIDGFTFTTLGQRLLVKNDTQSPAGAFNGVYSLTQLQASGVPPVFTRTADYNTPTSINAAGLIPVDNGTTNANTSWNLVSVVTTVGTSPLTYSQATAPPTGVVYVNAVQTLTNKRHVPRLVTVTQSATPATNTDNGDIFTITGLAQAITSMTTNLTGTPQDGEKIEYRITDNGTARAITWGAKFASAAFSLPTTTVASTRMRVLLEWDASSSVWACVGMVTTASGPTASLRDTYQAATQSGILYETVPRWSTSSTGTFTSGFELFTAISLPAGLTIGHLVMVSIGGATSPTHWWMALYDQNKALLASTADQTTTAFGANTLMALPIASIVSGASSTFTTTYTGLYYVSFMMAATTPITPNIVAPPTANLAYTVTPSLCFVGSTGGLTTPHSFPYTPTPASDATIFYAAVAS